MVLSCQIKLNDRLNNFYVLFSEFNIVLDWQESIRYQVMMIQCLQQVNYLINKEREREREQLMPNDVHFIQKCDLFINAVISLILIKVRTNYQS